MATVTGQGDNPNHPPPNLLKKKKKLEISPKKNTCLTTMDGVRQIILGFEYDRRAIVVFLANLLLRCEISHQMINLKRSCFGQSKTRFFG